MAIKNLQFIVTVGVDVPDDWECPTGGSTRIERLIVRAIETDDANVAEDLDARRIVNISAEFETITD